MTQVILLSPSIDCVEAKPVPPPTAAPGAGSANDARKEVRSWYLDPLAAEQKRHIFLSWIQNCPGVSSPGRVLKTDLFEEANNRDQILWDLYPDAGLRLGIELEPGTAARAAARCPDSVARCLAADVRALPLPDESVDVIVSTSTLDHFAREADLRASIEELARVLRPGGRLFLILDNPRNPLHPLLCWFSRRGWFPFFIGRTLSASATSSQLASVGLETHSVEWLIHNPRLISTVLFLVLRRLLGRYADAPIRMLLALFALMGKTPLRSWTACFHATIAIKPASMR